MRWVEGHNRNPRILSVRISIIMWGQTLSRLFLNMQFWAARSSWHPPDVIWKEFPNKATDLAFPKQWLECWKTSTNLKSSSVAHITYWLCMFGLTNLDITFNDILFNPSLNLSSVQYFVNISWFFLQKRARNLSAKHDWTHVMWWFTDTEENQ